MPSPAPEPARDDLECGMSKVRQPVSRNTVAKMYSTNEAVLTQLGIDLAAEGRVLPAKDLRLVDLLNFIQLPLCGHPDQLWAILMDARKNDPDLFRRLVSVWHHRQNQWMVLMREWLRQHGGFTRHGLHAALDWLAMSYGHAGLTLQQAEQLTVAEALSASLLSAQAAIGPQSTHDDSGQQSGIELIPGGFVYKGKQHDLTGKPRAMLEALLNSHFRRSEESDLYKVLDINPDAVEHDRQVILDTAKKLRAALRKAAEDAGIKCENPLPSTGKKKDLTYRLAMP
jgi:hypothetical protein